MIIITKGILQALFTPDADINSTIDIFLLLLFFHLLFLCAPLKGFHLQQKRNIDSFQNGHFWDVVTISFHSLVVKRFPGCTLGTFNQFTLKPIKHIWCIETNTCLTRSLWRRRKPLWRFEGKHLTSWMDWSISAPLRLDQQTHFLGLATGNLSRGERDGLETRLSAGE